ncbi:MAG: phenylacetate-CoA oxygenase subunit PaaI [Crocinitomicaceae bacterium]|nr:phenylacetate-CoA oxygenase subunit PaaI [Crocinitomicaceae bacterium]|tara:strand:- start:141 stop:899 length:759 start_codon:yes stop_codon:yes gene_type:complete
MEVKDALIQYCLRLGDDAMIMGHRLSELCSNGPILEEDIAMTNISLDLFGQTRIIYTYAAELEGKGRSEDDLAYLRPEHEFQCALLTEQPNGHFGNTMARQMIFSVFYYHLFKELSKSPDESLAAFAAKSLKETTYHMRHACEWVVRLGDGTEESKWKIQDALNDIWSYHHELFEKDEVDEKLIDMGIITDTATIADDFYASVNEVIERATLGTPAGGWKATGGRSGRHSEYLGHILSVFQSLPRAYPDAKW